MQTKSMKHSSASKAGGPRKRSNRCSKPADPHYHQQAPKRHKQCTPRWPTDAPVMTWHTTSCRVPGLSVTLRRHPPCGGIVRTSRHSSCSPQKGRDNAGGAFSMHGLARETALLHVRALVIVHFFSGFRRMGDIHHIIDHCTMQTGAHVFTLSVDLCMQRIKGDLATPQAARWWKERILSGQVVAAGGGPPCETFTVARQYDGGPRPLRSAAHPLGIPGLSIREWNQLRISDRLLRFLLDVLVALAMMGMSGFLEHPQFPTWCTRGSPASIWATEALIQLKNLGCFSVVSFDQCTVGALGKKTHNPPAPPAAPCEGHSAQERLLWALQSPTGLACGLDRQRA